MRAKKEARKQLFVNEKAGGLFEVCIQFNTDEKKKKRKKRDTKIDSSQRKGWNLFPVQKQTRTSYDLLFFMLVDIYVKYSFFSLSLALLRMYIRLVKLDRRFRIMRLVLPEHARPICR